MEQGVNERRKGRTEKQKKKRHEKLKGTVLKKKVKVEGVTEKLKQLKGKGAWQS